VFNNKLLEEMINSPYKDRLPKMEQEILHLSMKRIPQRDIAGFFGISQGAISSRLSRSHARLLFMKNLDDLRKQTGVTDLDKTLGEKFSPFEVELLKTMLETASQSETAEVLNALFNLKDQKRMNQIKVRHRFWKYLNVMKKFDLPYYPLFELLSRNLYMLREIKLPHFYKGNKL
jgi:DNA-directed RNA polymerase specialized sigma24 family protein